jgi:uncharacterized coiled-coil protein SlyX
MANPEDAVLPILRNIQAELADLRREVGDMRSDIKVLTERFDAFDDYLTYLTGLNARNQVDIKKIKEEMRSLKDRVDELEPQS